MQGTFIISPLNALDFKEVNALLPNFENTLSEDVHFEGIVNTVITQKFIRGERIRTQLFTDFQTIEIKLFDSLGNSSDIQAFLIKQATDLLTGEIQSYYEFDVLSSNLGCYTVKVMGTNSEGDTVHFESEKFELVEGVTKTRLGSDGQVFSYTYIPEHLKVIGINNENQFHIYWGSDRLVGEPFKSEIWIPATKYKAQSGGDTNVYSNQGNLTKLKEISQRLFELKTAQIPRFLALKVQELSSLDYFIVNDIQYISEDKGEIEYFNNYVNGVLTMTLTQAFAIGLNSDDQGAESSIINIMDKSVENKVLTNKSGNQQLTISGGYTLNQITITPTSGTSVTVTIGTTVGGSEILRPTAVLRSEVTQNIARNYINKIDPLASFTAYVNISGVGAAADITLQTIINKQ